jgi:tRNA (guanine-N7-)-methyltransferase
MENYRRRTNLTRTLPHQTQYTLALQNELASYAFCEERAPLNRGKWKAHVFQKPLDIPMDLEIGTGIGKHFAHYAQKHPDRLLVGVELKYKPLVQAIRKVLRQGSTNAAIARVHSFNLTDVFASHELDHIFLHFPDPWVSPRKPRHRTMRHEIMNQLFELQKPGCFFELKTDSREYFEFALEEVPKTPYILEFETRDLHRSKMKEENFITTFEAIFLKQNLPIYGLRLRKP